MLRPKDYLYSTSLKWTGERKGLLSCEGKPDVNIACPPEWGGHPGIWSPEDLFVASVEVCFMTTFLWLAGREGLKPVSYDSDATAVARMVEGEFSIASIRLNVRLEVPTGEDIGVARDLLEQTRKGCIVARSIVPEVELLHEIRVGDEGSEEG